jgi:hypothetical protein
VKRSSIVVVGLATSLVASNVWSLFQAVDSGVTATYRDVSLQEHHEALTQAFAVVPSNNSIRAGKGLI